MLFNGIPTIDTRNEQVDFSLPISVPWGTNVCVKDTGGLPFDLTGASIQAGLLDSVGVEILSFSMSVDLTTSCIGLSLTGDQIEAIGLGWYYWYLRVELLGETEYTYWVGGRWTVYRVYTYGPRSNLPNPDVVDVVVGTEIIASVNVCAISGAGGGGSGDLLAVNNLSDVDNAATSLANLGGATAAQGALADTALQTVAVPSDITAGGTPDATTFLRGDGEWAQPGGTSGDLLAANNLSDVDDAAISLTNLGGATAAQGALADTATQPGDLGTLAAKDSISVPGDVTATGTPDATTFLRGDGAWAAAGGTSGDLLAANNLSDVDDAVTSLSNLGGATAAQGALADTALQDAAAFATAAQGVTADTALQIVAVPSDITATGTPDATTFLRGDGAWATAGSGNGDLLAANNLSDVDDVATSRTNLGLGTAATTSASDYATAAQGALADTALQNAAAFATAAQGVTADSALQTVDVPTDITATGTPGTTTFLRGDGVWAEPTGTSGDLLAANNLSDVDNAATSLANLGGATAAQGALADTALQNAAAFATAAQGSTADSALQVVAVPSDITATGTPGTTTFLRGDGVWAEPAGTSGDLLAANNLSDVADAATSLANLGGATAAQGALADTALQNAAAFATAAQGVTADSALQVVAVPTDITATGTPGTTTFLRGDGTWAEPAGTAGDLLAANNLSDVADAPTSLANLGGATAAQGALADTALQNAAAFATAAQGALADTATQPGDLGTLAAKNSIDVPADVSATGTPSATTFLRGDGTWAEPAGTAGDLLAVNNLSDVADAATSLSNLGGATAAQGALADTALQDASAFATAAQGVLADAAAPLLAATTTRFRGYGATEPTNDLQVGDVFFSEGTSPSPVVPLPGGDSDVITYQPLLYPIDERSTELTYTGTNLTQVLEKSGATTIKQTDLAYTGTKLTSVVELADSITVTTTLTYTGDKLTSTGRVVS